MSKTDKSIDLLNEVLKTAQAIGIQETINANISARKSVKSLQEREAVKTTNNTVVIQEACKLYKSTYENLMLSRKILNRRTIFTIVYVYFRVELEYDLKEIANFFNRDISIVSKYITDYNRLSRENKFDLQIIEKYEKLKETLTDKIQK
jgi:hypothetical protein